MSLFGDSDSSELPSFPADSGNSKLAADQELQEFLMAEKQKAELSAQIHQFNDLCWEKCIDRPAAKLDSKAEMCLSNCVDRFIDVSLLVASRFAQLIQKSGS